jgi:diguanylate cyclase (GGDEF)-like protein
MLALEIAAALAGLAGLLLFVHRRAKAASSALDGPAADAAAWLCQMPGFLCLKDADGRWLQASPRYAALFGLDAADCAGKTDLELGQLPGSDREALRLGAAGDLEAWSLGQPTTGGAASGEGGGFEVTRTPCYGGKGQKSRLLITCAPPAAPGAVAPGLFASVFYMNKMPFALLDSTFKIANVNNAFSLFTGFSKKESVGKYIVFMGSQIEAEEFSSTLAAWFRKNPAELWSGELLCHTKGHNAFPIKLLVSALRTQTGGAELTHYFLCLFDITQQKENEKRIQSIAHYDELTGLPNRLLLSGQLARTLATATRRNLHLALLSINLNRFKAVNDSLGRQTGDLLLKEVAERLKVLFRKEDLVARLEGDEFALLCGNEPSHERAIYSASIIAQKIISRMSEHFYVNRHEVFISVGIGIAIFPGDAEDVETLLNNAGKAMAQAKTQGGNRFQFFHREHASTVKDKHRLELGLRKALQRKELQLHYQPQYSADSRRLCGAEVLIRWLQGQAKLISPYYFIDIAEETGLIIPIGKWILETACKQQKAWLDAGHGIKQVSVNVSARQFMDPHFVETVEEVLAKTRLDPRCLELEITESLLIGDTKRIELQLNRLKKRGIKIALDDFGTGYSSLAYLKNFPIDVVKIDQSFVRGMSPDSKDAKIVCAIIEMGHSLGYKVVAEGVENETQYLFLREQKCDIIQGYYFSRPLPTHEMTELLARA